MALRNHNSSSTNYAATPGVVDTIVKIKDGLVVRGHGHGHYHGGDSQTTPGSADTHTKVVVVGSSPSSVAAGGEVDPLVVIYQQIEDMGKSLRCAICQATLVEPCLLPCFHAFCKDCLDAYLRHARMQAAKKKGGLTGGSNNKNPQCPTCKLVVSKRSIRPSAQLGSVVRAFKETQQAFGMVPIVYSPTVEMTQLPMGCMDHGGGGIGSFPNIGGAGAEGDPSLSDCNTHLAVARKMHSSLEQYYNQGSKTPCASVNSRARGSGSSRRKTPSPSSLREEHDTTWARLSSSRGIGKIPSKQAAKKKKSVNIAMPKLQKQAAATCTGPRNRQAVQKALEIQKHVLRADEKALMAAAGRSGTDGSIFSSILARTLKKKDDDANTGTNTFKEASENMLLDTSENTALDDLPPLTAKASPDDHNNKSKSNTGLTTNPVNTEAEDEEDDEDEEVPSSLPLQAAASTQSAQKRPSSLPLQAAASTQSAQKRPSSLPPQTAASTQSALVKFHLDPPKSKFHRAKYGRKAKSLPSAMQEENKGDALPIIGQSIRVRTTTSLPGDNDTSPTKKRKHQGDNDKTESFALQHDDEDEDSATEASCSPQKRPAVKEFQQSMAAMSTLTQDSDLMNATREDEAVNKSTDDWLDEDEEDSEVDATKDEANKDQAVSDTVEPHTTTEPPPAAIFTKGTIVTVAPRTWPGINKPGGVGRIVKVNHGGNDANNGSDTDQQQHIVTYDVAYVMGGKDKGIEAKFVSCEAQEEYENRDDTSPPKHKRRRNQEIPIVEATFDNNKENNTSTSATKNANHGKKKVDFSNTQINNKRKRPDKTKVVKGQGCLEKYFKKTKRGTLITNDVKGLFQANHNPALTKTPLSKTSSTSSGAAQQKGPIYMEYTLPSDTKEICKMTDLWYQTRIHASVEKVSATAVGGPRRNHAC
jgi:hypothetical protein